MCWITAPATVTNQSYFFLFEIIISRRTFTEYTLCEMKNFDLFVYFIYYIEIDRLTVCTYTNTCPYSDSLNDLLKIQDSDILSLILEASPMPRFLSGIFSPEGSPGVVSPRWWDRGCLISRNKHFLYGSHSS